MIDDCELSAETIDTDAFAQKIFMRHDEFEGGLIQQLRQRQDVLWQDKLTSPKGQAQERLLREIRLWEAKVDKYADIKIAAAEGRHSDTVLPSAPIKVLGQTPLIMRVLGSDHNLGIAAASGGIYVAPHFFDSKHANINPSLLKQIPQKLIDPIAVFDTASKGRKDTGRVIFMLDLQDKNGATIIVPVTMQGKSDKPGVFINLGITAYSKEKKKKAGKVIKIKPDNKWFVEQLQKNARFFNGQKLKSWQASSGVQFPIALPYNSSRVLNNSLGNRVRTEADLVKWREQFPELYQGENNARGAMTTLPDGRAVIALFEKGDVST